MEPMGIPILVNLAGIAQREEREVTVTLLPFRIYGVALWLF
jgi:hypothetical protein